MPDTLRNILDLFESQKNDANLAGMARYGINTAHAYGVTIPVLRKMAKEIGRDHTLAAQLWASGSREARILAVLVEDPNDMTGDQAERWAVDLNSWDVCDHFCAEAFTPKLAWEKVDAWCGRPEEFVKRAGFALMARLPRRDKEADDDRFLALLPIIEREANDERNYVKKAVNWALREIGKRSRALNRAALETADRLKTGTAGSERWIGSDAARELRSEKVQARWAKLRSGAKESE